MFIAIAGGHASSDALVAETKDAEAAKIPDLPALPIHRVDYQEFKDRIELVNEALSKNLKKSIDEMQLDTCSLVVSLPGVGTLEDNDYATAIFQECGWPQKAIRVIDDTWAALFAHTKVARGVCAYAGVGASVCVAMGRFSLKPRFKIDGWGPIIGDFGSKFQIAVDFFRHLCRLRDGELESPLFLRLQQANKNISDINQVQRWFDNYIPHRDKEWPVEFSSFADVVINEVESNHPDEHAISIVHDAADTMVASILMAARRLNEPPDCFPFVLQGELFRQSRTYLERVQQQLRAHRIVAAEAREEPLAGAYAYALKPTEETLIERI